MAVDGEEKVKTNKEQGDKLLKALENIRKKHGKNSIVFAGEDRSRIDIERWSTGIADIDDMLEGGMPKSRLVEVWGQKSAGKTSFLYKCASQNKYAYLADAEGTADLKRAMKIFNCRPKSIFLESPDSGEETIESIIEMVKAEVPLIMVDSVPALVPHKVLEKAKGDLTKETYAGVASLLSRTLPVLITYLKKSPSTVIFVNQVRDNIGVMFGDPWKVPGGNALEHYKALSIQVNRRGWIGSKDARIGQLCAFRVTKSKVGTPFKYCEVPLLFDKGYVSHEDAKLAEKAAEKANRLKKRELKEEDDD